MRLGLLLSAVVKELFGFEARRVALPGGKCGSLTAAWSAESIRSIPICSLFLGQKLKLTSSACLCHSQLPAGGR